MKLQCIGGGPAGLYFAILMKRQDPAHQVTVVERHRPGETTGWGLVLTNSLLDRLQAHDPVSAAEIRRGTTEWSDISVEVAGQSITCGGHRFLGISRLALITILQQRAQALGVQVEYECQADPQALPHEDADLTIISDGANSRVRTHFAERFEASLDVRANKYIWLGTRRTFENAFKFLFERTPAGWIWAHCYQFDADTSTFVVECSERTWRGLGFDRCTPEEAARACEGIFAAHLDGHSLLVSSTGRRQARWTHFVVVSCGRWWDGDRVLLGNAAHSAHFSIGSGTRLALEDAMALAEALSGGGAPDPQRLAAYQRRRQEAAAHLREAALNSMVWFENLDAYLELEPLQFTYALLTRSGLIGHEDLRQRDEVLLQRVERWFARSHGLDNDPDPDAGARSERLPARLPLKLRGIMLKNRIVNQYNGVGDKNNAGLVMLDVAVDHHRDDGGDGLAEAAELRQRVAASRDDSRACIGVRLVGGSRPLEDGTADLSAVQRRYLALAHRAERAGADLLVLDPGADPALRRCAGAEAGTEGRLAPAVAVLRAVRSAWPAHKPIAVSLALLCRQPAEELAAAEPLAAAAGLFRTEEADVLEVPLDHRLAELGATRAAGEAPAIWATGAVERGDLIDALILSGRADLYLHGGMNLQQ